MTFHFYPLHDRIRKARREFLCNLIAVPRVQHRTRQISIRQHTHSDNRKTDFYIFCDAFVLRLSLAKSAFLETSKRWWNFRNFPRNKQAGVSLRYRIDSHNFHFSPSTIRREVVSELESFSKFTNKIRYTSPFRYLYFDIIAIFLKESVVLWAFRSTRVYDRNLACPDKEDISFQDL